MQIGKFLTIGFVGGGNFGKVFKAQDTLLNVERAIKLVQVQNPQEFVDAIFEAQILEKCRHSHIVDIKEVDIHEINGSPVPCIVTEYLSKGSVQGYLENNFVSIRNSCQIISDILFGLEHAHNNGIYHRDIKPGNILFSDTGQAKLSDFGLAYGLANQAFSFAGYNAHLPPEVLEGSAQDHISDHYAVGVTFYRLLNNLVSLDLPFADDNEWIKAIKKEKFPKREYKPYVPEQIFRIVNKAIKSDRGSRFQTCLEFRQAIEKIPLAVEWIPNSEFDWTGLYKKAFGRNASEYSLSLYWSR